MVLINKLVKGCFRHIDIHIIPLKEIAPAWEGWEGSQKEGFHKGVMGQAPLEAFWGHHVTRLLDVIWFGGQVTRNQALSAHSGGFQRQIHFYFLNKQLPVGTEACCMVEVAGKERWGMSSIHMSDEKCNTGKHIANITSHFESRTET